MFDYRNSTYAWNEAEEFCERQEMKLVRYVGHMTFHKAYKQAKRSARLFGLHGLGHILFLGSVAKVKYLNYTA